MTCHANRRRRGRRARLARWGVLDAVLAAGTPVTRGIRFDQGDAVITGRFPACQGVEVMCSPRRTLLDRVLVDAAGTSVPAQS